MNLKRLSKIILILAVGLYVSYKVIHRVDHDVIFDEQINLGLIISACLIFVWVINKDTRLYFKSKKFTEFLPTFIGLFITIGLVTTLYLLHQRDKSPIKFACVSKIVDFNGVRIEFRKDGTYKLCNFCLGADYYRGKYKIQDSIITLDKSNIDKVIETKRLVIRADGQKDDNGIIEKSIYQIDKDGNILDRAVDYRLLNNIK